MKRYLAVLIALFYMSTLWSKTIYVHNSATGSNNGKSWSNAYVSLQSAISQAISGDEIWVAEGVYVPGNKVSDYFKAKAGVSLYGGFNGSESLREERNPLLYKSVLSGEIGTAVKTDNAHRILLIDKTVSSPIAISGFTISDGYAEDFIGIVEIAS